MRRVALLLGLAACAGGLWAFPDPPVALEPATQLGPVVWESSEPRFLTVRSAQQGDQAVVSVVRGAGYAGDDWEPAPATAEVLRIDLDSGTVSSTGAPQDLAQHPEVVWGTSLDTGDLVLARPDATFNAMAAIYTAGAWTTEPLPYDATLLTQLIWHDGLLLLNDGDTVLVGDSGVTAQAVIEARPSVMVTAWQGDELRVVWQDGSQLCTELIDVDEGARSQDCTEIGEGFFGTRTLGPPALSGTLGEAQVLVIDDQDAVAVFVYDASGWREGDVLPGVRFVDHPGSLDAALVESHLDYDAVTPVPAPESNPGMLWVSAGELQHKVIDDFSTWVGCGCDRLLDPDCACAPREPAGERLMVHDGRAFLLSVDFADAQRRIQLVELPADGGDPWFPDAACPADTCPVETDRCDLDALGQPFCEPFNPRFGG